MRTCVAVGSDPKIGLIFAIVVTRLTAVKMREAAGEAPDQNEPQPPCEAEYTLESPVTCPLCRANLEKVNIVRLLRTRVNFTSNLPRRGCVAVCPSCRGIVPAVIVSLLS